MSYATSLLAPYPSSYGPSTLFSDDLVGRSPYDNLYPPSVPYMSSGRLISDDIAFNQISQDTSTYRPPLYSITNSSSVYPTNNYQNNWHRPVQSNDSFALSNDITEYSESLGTASNTNTASSVARSINGYTMSGPINMYNTNHQQNYNQPGNVVNNNSQHQSMWSSSPQTKTKGQTNEIKPKTTFKQQPQANKTQIQSQTNIKKKPLNDDTTPVQSPKQIEKQPSSINIEAWLNDSKKESPIDEAAAEQAWSVKIGQLHMTQAQREKEKAKSTRALPIAPKKVDNKPIVSKTKPSNDPTYQVPHDSYFDSLFDGDYFRKTSNEYSLNSSYQQPKSTKNKLTTNAFNNSNPNSVSKTSKYGPQRKTPRYEPPTPKRAPPPPTITTTTWRKQLPRQYQYDGIYPYYLHDEFLHRDFAHKDTDERFREALQKLRADRAEQQQKDINEKTAKRLHYGDYVRHSTKDALLQNAVKPSPWSDFMDLKKGNLYSLSKEEKRRLYNQSKSYGERVRYRNFAIHYGNETARSHRHSVPFLGDSEESEAGDVTPRQSVHNGNSKPISRTTVRTGRSNRASEDEDGTKSDPEANRKHKQLPKKKNVRYAKYDSSGRTTVESDHEIDTQSQRSVRTRNRDMNDDLFTVREEKTLETIEGGRYKKR